MVSLCKKCEIDLLWSISITKCGIIQKIDVNAQTKIMNSCWQQCRVSFTNFVQTDNHDDDDNYDDDDDDLLLAAMVSAMVLAEPKS